MEAGDSAPSLGPEAPAAATPQRRWKRKVLLGFSLLLVLACGIRFLPRKPTAPTTGLLKFKVLNYAPGPNRTVTLLVENRSASTLLCWEPCRVERKETGKITVSSSTTSTRLLGLRGTNAAGSAPRPLFVQLTDTNHGPWRLLVPVARYEWVAHCERLLGKPTFSLVKQLRVLDSLLQHSRTWVASDWFEEQAANPMGWAGFPGLTNSLQGGSHAASLAMLHHPAFTEQQNDNQRMFFILRNFYRRYSRWPRNMPEVKRFADDKANFQPEFPARFESEAYSNAVFTPNPDGGLTIRCQNATMTLGGSPK